MMSKIPRLIGEKFSYKRAGLRPNTCTKVHLTVTDSLGEKFSNQGSFKAGSDGVLNISENNLQNLISTAKATRKASFVLHEFNSYNIDISIAGKSEHIPITAGIGNVITREELRGKTVANVFYPSTGHQFKSILHINGGVPLLQDARSIMLAREGYLVMELGYNLPQYGQQSLFLRHELDLEYFIQSARLLLQHPKSYGDRVVVMGQSKGADIAIALGQRKHLS